MLFRSGPLSPMSVPSGKNRFDLVDGLFCKLHDKVQPMGVASLSAEERVVYFAWAALGVLGNGSFQYFFENNLDANATAQSFQEVLRRIECQVICWMTCSLSGLEDLSPSLWGIPWKSRNLDLAAAVDSLARE